MNVRHLTAAAVLASGLAAAALLAGAGQPADTKAPAPAPASAAKPEGREGRAPVSAGAYRIDNVHSSVIFKVKHSGVSNFYARFNTLSGEFMWDGAKPEATSVTATIDAASVDTRNERLDGHLKSPDFFNTAEHPKITFKSTGLTKAGEGWKLAGDMTMMGVTKPVTGTFTPVGEKTGERGTMAGFEVQFTIKRSEFGMDYGVANGALGDDVTIMVSIEGQKK